LLRRYVLQAFFSFYTNQIATLQIDNTQSAHPVRLNWQRSGHQFGTHFDFILLTALHFLLLIK
jgi:hypothetical protein